MRGRDSCSGASFRRGGPSTLSNLPRKRQGTVLEKHAVQRTLAAAAAARIRNGTQEEFARAVRFAGWAIEKFAGQAARRRGSSWAAMEGVSGHSSPPGRSSAASEIRLQIPRRILRFLFRYREELVHHDVCDEPVHFRSCFSLSLVLRFDTGVRGARIADHGPVSPEPEVFAFPLRVQALKCLSSARRRGWPW